MMFVGTALASAAMAMLFAGMLAVWVTLRDAAGGTTATWLPKGVAFPGVATNIMLITMLGAVVLAQWALYAMARDNRRDTAVAVALLVIFGLAVFNAQVYVYQQSHVVMAGSKFAPLFYGITGAFLVALLAGMVMAFIVVFRSLGGRYSARRHDGVSSLALYWYVLTAVFCGIWYVVYVVK
jgi:heme/copper-type cytochrome/quinol oxidase subunit 3